ncbi:Putative N-acetyl-LL-diaminopimelate aminotransferase [Paraliobacillus sp. PM-2]|uniref:aminotransferase A n=1 Tax=Paraliobacillus sp. PM-2 TaxID=1462524 RepID=UPI00061CC9D2|nr:aminotransferase A [Paraliobacillus sp. PM-2]CQR47853.1 Putative N-acetyl-LL-diaminopimelate aminotransferase [Paraliobacillus sp. PM-2]
MEHLLNSNVKKIEISGIRKFFNMVNDKEDILSLTIGQPDFTTPEHIKKAAQQAVENNYTTYTHNAGILSLRQAISDAVGKDYQLHYNPTDEIIVTVGASQAIDITLRTIIETGDEVLLPGPVYPGYEPLIRLAGAKPVYIDTTDSGFKITPDKLKQQITSKTKCLILPYPSNPTGVTLTKDELIAIAEVIKDKDIFVIADEIYSKLTYDTTHVSIASLNDQIKQKTIVINGVSKSHAMTGWRIGYLLAPSWLTKHILKVHQYNVSCATSISQYAALAAITNGTNDPIIMNKSYQKRRDYVYERLLHMGMEVVKPDGAFYFFPKIKSNLRSFDFALKLVNEVGLALVPGNAFSHYGEGYVRLSYAYNLETLEQGLNRLEAFIK